MKQTCYFEMMTIMMRPVYPSNFHLQSPCPNKLTSVSKLEIKIVNSAYRLPTTKTMKFQKVALSIGGASVELAGPVPDHRAAGGKFEGLQHRTGQRYFTRSNTEIHARVTAENRDQMNKLLQIWNHLLAHPEEAAKAATDYEEDAEGEFATLYTVTMQGQENSLAIGTDVVFQLSKLKLDTVLYLFLGNAGRFCAVKTGKRGRPWPATKKQEAGAAVDNQAEERESDENMNIMENNEEGGDEENDNGEEKVMKVSIKI
jgi:hypothetical protein